MTDVDNFFSELKTRFMSMEPVEASAILDKIAAGRRDLEALFRSKTPRLKRTPEYQAFMGMISRCKPGGIYEKKGISIFPEWRHDFQAFLAHVGHRPSPKHSIDRYPDNKGNYEPGNVRWATQQQQLRNYSRNRLVTIDGVTLCLKEWAERLGADYNRVNNRVFIGWDPVEALMTPKDMRQARPQKKKAVA